MSVVARWSLLSRNASLARSSHCLSVSATGRAVIYGGELKPRTPVDAEENTKGTLHLFDIPRIKPELTSEKWQTTTVKSKQIPDSRVGAASAVLGDKLYLWGGRGGVDMAPISGEQAGVWVASLTDVHEVVWERLTAVNESEAPQPRSYHTIVAHSVCHNPYIHSKTTLTVSM